MIVNAHLLYDTVRYDTIIRVHSNGTTSLDQGRKTFKLNDTNIFHK